jgi:hypothetical protein
MAALYAVIADDEVAKPDAGDIGAAASRSSECQRQHNRVC